MIYEGGGAHAEEDYEQLGDQASSRGRISVDGPLRTQKPLLWCRILDAPDGRPHRAGAVTTTMVCGVLQRALSLTESHRSLRRHIGRRFRVPQLAGHLAFSTHRGVPPWVRIWSDPEGIAPPR